MFTKSVRRLCAVALASTLLCSVAAHAQTVEEFYKRRNSVDLLIGFGAGSSFDVWARLVAKHLKKHVPGNPTFVVKAMPGAGGLTMMDFFANQAAKDGTVIGSFSANLPTQVLTGGTANLKVEPRDFGFLGSPELSDHACAVMTASGIRSVEDAMAKEAPMAGTGPSTPPSYLPPIFNKMVGTRFKVVEGYQSSAEVFLAMERGEVAGTCSRLESIVRTQADKLKSGAMKILFNVNEKPDPKLGGLPSIFSYIKSADDRQLLNFIRSSQTFGRPFATPPGVPKDRFDALRTAFEKTVADPEFLGEAEKMQLEVTLTTGPELEQLLADLYKTPKSLIDQAAKMIPN